MDRILKFLIFSLLIFAITQDSKANYSNKDSLLQRLSIVKGDERVNTLNILAWELRERSFEEAKSYSLDALGYSQKIKYKNGEAKALFNLGVIFSIRNKFDSAKLYLQKSLAEYQQLKNYKQVARTYNGIATTYISIGDYNIAEHYFGKAIEELRGDTTDKIAALIYGNRANVFLYQGKYDRAILFSKKAIAIHKVKNPSLVSPTLVQLGIAYKGKQDYLTALDYYLKGLQLEQEKNDYAGVASVHANLGNLYKTLKKYDKALESFKTSLDYTVKNKQKLISSRTYNNIGIIYYRLSNDSLALMNFSKSIELKREINSTNQIWSAYVNIGQIYVDWGKVDTAKHIFFEALLHVDSVNNKLGKTLILLKLANAFYTEGNLEQCIKYAKEALHYSLELGNLKYSQDIYGVLTLAYEKLNMSDTALSYYKHFQLFKDSILEKSPPFEMAQLLARERLEEKQEELDTKRNEIRLLREKEKKENFKKTLLIVGVLVALIGLVLVYFKLRKKIKFTKKKFKTKETVLINEKEAAITELETKKREITSLALNISRQSSLLNDVRDVLETSKSLNTLQKNVKHILGQESFAEKEWEHFNKRFTQLHPGFIEKFKKDYPSLTTSEIRLCMLIKIQLDTNEVASILNITVPSVNTARYRMRKKLSIPKEIALDDFINQL